MNMDLKKRLSVFLCLLLTIPAIMGALPQAKLEVQAASNQISINTRRVTTTSEIQITTKTKGFYVGDLFSAYAYGSNYKNYGVLSMNSGVTYKSSKPAVASVDKKSGLIKAKKKGNTTITVKFKGASSSLKIKVVSSLGTVPSYKNLEKAADNLIKAYGKNINNKNRYQVVNAQNLYVEEYNRISSMYHAGLISSYDAKRQVYVYKVFIPAITHADAVSDTVNDYKNLKNPVGTGQAKLLEVTSVSGKNNMVTAKLSKKVTADQIFGLKAASSKLWDTKIEKGKKAEFPVYIRDAKTGHKYYAIATATEGKNTLSIKLRSQKLKKGSYKLQGMVYHAEESGISYYSFTGDWTNQGNTTFKVK